MESEFNTMVFINLHETEYLIDVLECLSEEYVHETIVSNGESIQSRHDKNIPNLSFILQTLRDESNNNIITAVTDKRNIASLSERLKTVKSNDKYACSFWFIPIDGYFWHKS